MKPHSLKTLRALGEDGALASIERFMAPAGGSIVVGMGDDAAAVRIPGSDELLLATADMLVEGVHFLTEWGDWRAIGRKAMAVNLSDVAAMGGRPAEALVSIGLPPDFAEADWKALYRGLATEARRAGVLLVGGDTVRADHPTISVTVLGRADGNRPLPLRSHCRPGQSLYVTGTLGDSAAGLALLCEKGLGCFRAEPWARTLVNRHLLPTPRLAAGLALAQALEDLAMIDVSDDLARECRLLAEASKASVCVDADALPLSRALRRFAAATGRDARAHALHGGEDFELLFATGAPLEAIHRVLKRRAIRLPVARIGDIGKGPAGHVEVRQAPSGTLKPFEHFG
ncbi:MAG: thiamine-phosphate kinase [Candidatus Sumerlaeota bacterium]|nr:thiamine-phosphate kinase [Candidatus Sumerlaeota bacterium]